MRWKLAAAICIAVAVVIGWATGLSWRKSRAHDARIEQLAALDARVWPLGRAIDEAADYIVRVNGPDGRFVYRRFADGRDDTSGAYSIVRHAGTIFALAEYAHSAGEGRRARVATTIERASTYLLARGIRPVAGRPELLAVWSDPQEEGLRRPVAKLGGAALALVALATSAQLGGRDAGAGASEMEAMRGLARFICFMQRSDGAFHSQYEDEKGYVGSVSSLYFPGEAVLGLTMLYEIDPDARWREAATRGVAHLVESRRGATTLPNDHWLMIAIARLLPHHTGVSPISSEEMLAHAIDLGRTMMREQADVLSSGGALKLSGAFDAQGAVTPASTRLEGLLALERALAGKPEHEGVRKEVRAAIELGIAFIRRAQIQTGPGQGGFPQVVSIATPGGASDASVDDDSARSLEVRIDYVQHALSALLGYEASAR